MRTQKFCSMSSWSNDCCSERLSRFFSRLARGSFGRLSTVPSPALTVTNSSTTAAGVSSVSDDVDVSGSATAVSTAPRVRRLSRARPPVGLEAMLEALFRLW